MLPDILYVLGKGSNWHNNEIRYSLRSLQNLPHNRVFVIGERLDWFQNIYHIPADDPYRNKQRNTIRKLRLATEHPALGDEFILFNDDFYVLKPIDHLPVYYRFTMKEMVEHFSLYKKEKLLQSDNSKKYVYEEAILNTYKRFPDGLDYSLHMPMTFNKEKLRSTLWRLGAKPVLLRSEYGNDHCIGGTKHHDVKLQGSDIFVPKIHGQWDFISSDDHIKRRNVLQQFLSERFPHPSKYEKHSMA
jgi:hypothetical protein